MAVTALAWHDAPDGAAGDHRRPGAGAARRAAAAPHARASRCRCGNRRACDERRPDQGPTQQSDPNAPGRVDAAGAAPVPLGRRALRGRRPVAHRAHRPRPAPRRGRRRRCCPTACSAPRGRAARCSTRSWWTPWPPSRCSGGSSRSSGGIVLAVFGPGLGRPVGAPGAASRRRAERRRRHHDPGQLGRGGRGRRRARRDAAGRGRARARLVGSAAAPALRVTLWLADDADVRAVLRAPARARCWPPPASVARPARAARGGAAGAGAPAADAPGRVIGAHPSHTGRPAP